MEINIQDNTKNKYAYAKNVLFSEFSQIAMNAWMSNQKLEKIDFMENDDYPFRVKFHAEFFTNKNMSGINVNSLDIALKNSDELLYENISCEEWLNSNIYDKE